MDDLVEQVFQEEAPPQPEAPPAAEEVKEPVPETPAEIPETPQPEAAPPEKHIPFDTALGWREERNELRKELEKLRAQPQAVPDPVDDPQGYEAHVEQRLEQRLTAQKFEVSNVMARREHGEDKVEAATAWALEKAKSDPVFAAKYMREPHPLDWIVRQHEQDALLSEIGTDPVAYARKIAEREGWLTASPAVKTPVEAAPPKQAESPPPKSIASDPASPAKITEQGDKEDFLAAFAR